MRPQVISFKCILKNKAGRMISSTFNKEVLTSVDGAHEGMLSGLAKKLQNLTKGEKRSIELFAEEAYGLYDPQKIILFPRKNLPRSVKKGEAVSIVSKTGVRRAYLVVELHSDFASLDGNHPLAGQDLVFEIETIDARDATAKEIDASSNVVSSQLLH
ncbi:MAG: FKBP-type peptidyl-prolyl cis-trans isomerase [Bdellovibrionales bacterium]|nr:FKBP-type peptidyl-prolyl cis-trans isomerase [Bdellovibrionales bacterium]